MRRTARNTGKAGSRDRQPSGLHSDFRDQIMTHDGHLDLFTLGSTPGRATQRDPVSKEQKQKKPQSSDRVWGAEYSKRDRLDTCRVLRVTV